MITAKQQSQERIAWLEHNIHDLEQMLDKHKWHKKNIETMIQTLEDDINIHKTKLIDLYSKDHLIKDE